MVITIFIISLIALALLLAIIKLGAAIVGTAIFFVAFCIVGTVILLASGFSRDSKRKVRMRVYASVVFAATVLITGLTVSNLEEDTITLRDSQEVRHRAHNSDTVGSSPTPANAISLFDNEH
jgi:hypothetical protein